METADGEILIEHEKLEEFNVYFADIFFYQRRLSLNATKLGILDQDEDKTKKEDQIVQCTSGALVRAVCRPVIFANWIEVMVFNASSLIDNATAEYSCVPDTSQVLGKEVILIAHVIMLAQSRSKDIEQSM